MKKLLAMACVLMSIPSASFAYVCPRTYPMAVHYTLFETANGAISQGIAQVDIGLSSFLNYYSPRVEAALATLAKQKAYSSKQIADVTRAVAQQIANARKATSKKTRHLKARYDYGKEFGQGYEPCLQVAVRQAMTTRQTDMDAIRSQRVTTEVLGGPGNYRNQTQARRELMQANRKFCTQDQVDSGFCDVVGGFPGASVNVTTLFQSAPDDNPITEAKNTVINNMIGLPDDEIMKGSENSAQTAAYVAAKARKDALLSPAINSLKAIQLDYSGTAGTESGKDKSVAALFDEEIKRYGGNSEEHDRWASVLRAQKEHGLMIELLRAQGLKLALQHKHYQQLERMEAVLATIVANEVQGAGVDALSEASAERASMGQKATSIQSR